MMICICIGFFTHMFCIGDATHINSPTHTATKNITTRDHRGGIIHVWADLSYLVFYKPTHSSL